MSPRRDTDAGAPKRGKARHETREENASVEDALDRAARHARRAAAEGVAALRALLEAAALASGLEREPIVARLDELLVALAALADDADIPRAHRDAVVERLLTALDHEIARWEGRSRTDPDARAVLRAFLGMRELCWELGLRRGPAADASRTGDRDRSPDTDDSPSTRRATPARPRVKRVEVEG